MKKSLLKAAIFGSVLLACQTPGLVGATQRTNDQRDNRTAPDNTGVNRRDRSDQNPTAGQQKENPGDRELAQKIRSSIEDDKNLSTYAHNVKVIVQDGAVTLRGPVNTAQEKQVIAQKAAAIAGRGKVKNELEVVPEKK